MNKQEFETTFKLLCANPERPLSLGQLKDKRELFWLKFGKLDKNIFFDACMSWIDKSKFMPSIIQIRDVIDYQESAKQEPIKQSTQQPIKRRKTMREYFEIANKDIEGKKRHRIEHIDLVDLYDSLDRRKGNKNKKRTEVIKGSGIKKLNECL